jgi:hypothetical protein
MIEESLSIPRRFVSEGTIRMILENIARGKSVEASCGAAGVGKTSWYRWLSEDSALAARYGEALREQTSSRYAKNW